MDGGAAAGGDGGLWLVGRGAHVVVFVLFKKTGFLNRFILVGKKNERHTPHPPRPAARTQQGDSPPSQLPWSFGKKVRSGGFSSHHSSPTTQHRRTHPTIHYAAFSNLGFSVVRLKNAHAVPLASARQHPENQKENQAGHSSERTVEGRRLASQ